MGSVFAGNEETMEDKLRHDLCVIAEQYEQFGLHCRYCGIYVIERASADEQLSALTNHSTVDSSSAYPGPNFYSKQQLQSTHNNKVSHHDASHSRSHSASLSQNHIYHSSSIRSNALKAKEKREIGKITDVDYKQFYQWKIDQVITCEFFKVFLRSC